MKRGVGGDQDVEGKGLTMVWGAHREGHHGPSNRAVEGEGGHGPAKIGNKQSVTVNMYIPAKNPQPRKMEGFCHFPKRRAVRSKDLALSHAKSSRIAGGGGTVCSRAVGKSRVGVVYGGEWGGFPTSIIVEGRWRRRNGEGVGGWWRSRRRRKGVGRRWFGELTGRATMALRIGRWRGRVAMAPRKSGTGKASPSICTSQPKIPNLEKWRDYVTFLKSEQQDPKIYPKATPEAAE